MQLPMGMMLETAGEYTRLFNLDLQLLFDSGLTLLAVFALFLILSYNLFNPARKVLKGRQERISNDIKSAEENKEAARKLREEYEAKLKEVDKEVEQILADARKRGLASENKIIAEAKKEADSIVERANAEAELAKKNVRDEVKQEMIQIASLMAEKVIRKNMDTTIQEGLLEDTLKEIGNDTWQN